MRANGAERSRPTAQSLWPAAVDSALVARERRIRARVDGLPAQSRVATRWGTKCLGHFLVVRVPDASDPGLASATRAFPECPQASVWRENPTVASLQHVLYVQLTRVSLSLVLREGPTSNMAAQGRRVSYVHTYTHTSYEDAICLMVALRGRSEGTGEGMTRRIACPEWLAMIKTPRATSRNRRRAASRSETPEQKITKIPCNWPNAGLRTRRGLRGENTAARESLKGSPGLDKIRFWPVDSPMGPRRQPAGRSQSVGGQCDARPTAG